MSPSSSPATAKLGRGSSTRMGLRVDEPRPSFAVAGDELGDIPAFLRRERVPS